MLELHYFCLLKANRGGVAVRIEIIEYYFEPLESWRLLRLSYFFEEIQVV